MEAGERLGPLGKFLSLSRFQQFFLAAFVGGLFSRIGIFLTGYSSDDFYYALMPSSEIARSIRQGRVFAPVFGELLANSGFTLPSIQLPLFFISLFALAALLAKAFDMILLPGRATLLAAAAAALCSAYPYLTSYYLYRMVIFDQIVIYLLVLAALTIIANPKLGLTGKIVFGGIVVGLGSTDNQLVFILYFLIGLAYFVAQALRCRFMRSSTSTDAPIGMRELLVVPATLILGVAIYWPVTKIVQQATGFTPDSAYNVGSAGLLKSLTIGPQLMYDVILTGDPIVPLYMKIAMLVLLAIIFICALARSWRAALALLVYGFITIAISIAPMAVTWGGHAARIFMGVGFSLALLIGLGSNFVRRPFWPAVLAVCLTVLYCFSGATMFYQQHLLSRWDIYRATNIYMDIAQNFDINPATKIEIIGGTTLVNKALSTHGPDNALNESALRSDWGYAYPGLFLVATGKTLNVDSGDPAACNGKPAWPREGSIFKAQKDVISVCL